MEESKVSFGPQIQRFLKNTNFIKVMTVPEIEAWKGCLLVVEIFLSNHKYPNYE